MIPLLLKNEHLETLNNVERKRHLQKIKIIRHLFVKREDSNAEICNRLNISSPTSMALINELMEEGLVVKQGRGISVGGRRPHLFGLQDGSFFVLSIHMEKFKTKMAIFDNNNRCVTEIETYPLPVSRDMASIEQLHAFAEELLLRTGIDTSRLIGIGLSIPGLVNSQEGKSFTYFLNQEPNTLQQVLESKFHKPVFIQNDVKSACLAEFRFGLAHGLKNVLVLSLDWGIGLGIIVDGKIRSGSSGFAGEFGHIPLVEDGLLCHCGKRGCLETVASGIALARIAKSGIKSGQSTFLNKLSSSQIDQLEPQLVIEAANEGDQYAINILSEIGMNLGKGIAMLIQLFNPELIILGGKIAEAKQYITTPIQQSINTYCMTQLRERTRITLSELGPNASIYGSVATVMENILQNQITLAKQDAVKIAQT